MMDGSSIGSGEAEVYLGSAFEESYNENGEFERPAHHPSAPIHELFDISTTVDPSYIISLIRKLLPVGNINQSQGIEVHDRPSGGPRTEKGKKHTVSPFNGGDAKPCAGSENDIGDSTENFGEGNGTAGFVDDVELQLQQKHLTSSEREAAWEEHGCTLWDLAASETHAELMVQNLILEVLLANLMISQSVRSTVSFQLSLGGPHEQCQLYNLSVLSCISFFFGIDITTKNPTLELLYYQEIILGIMGNLACHEASRTRIASTKGLIETITNQLFLDDARCLCEAFRLMSLCLQGGEAVIWTEALSPGHILSRILWVAENTLNLELIEKSVGLLLTILGSQQDIATVLLPPLMKLGLPSLLINLFAFEMSKLTEEGMSERYSVLDIILQAIEALSAVDDFSSYVCLCKELFKLLNDLIKLPDKLELASSCVTAAVLAANILTDLEHLVCEISQDMDFLQGIFDIVPFASDDIEAKSALWSILARLLNCIKIGELNPSSLHQYISILVSNSDMIEEELLNLQLDEATEDSKSFRPNVKDLNARSRVLRGIFDVLSQWRLLKARAREAAVVDENFVNKGDVDKLLDICSEFINCEKSFSCT